MKHLFIIIFILVESTLFASSEIISEFSKLEENELFSYAYDNSKNNNLLIYKETSSTKELLFELSNQYGNIQISQDGKKIIYSSKMDKKRNVCDYYLIDGTIGKISFLVSEHQYLVTSKDFDYYIILGNFDDKTGQEIIIISISDNKKYSVYWNISQRLGGSCICYRSLYDDFLFRIDYEQEGFLYGSCFYDVITNQIYEIFNKTDATYEHEKKRTHTKFEKGQTR